MLFVCFNIVPEKIVDFSCQILKDSAINFWDLFIWSILYNRILGGLVFDQFYTILNPNLELKENPQVLPCLSINYYSYLSYLTPIYFHMFQTLIEAVKVMINLFWNICLTIFWSSLIIVRIILFYYILSQVKPGIT